MSSWSRLVRFVPISDISQTQILIGEPIDQDVDVGLALFEGREVKVQVYEGDSVLRAGEKTLKVEIISKVLSPLSKDEIGSIRCIGLNYANHAKEAKLSIPIVPTLFIKPSTSLCDPFPSKVVIPKWTIPSQSSDYESELVVVIGKTCKNVSEEEALSFVLGYTAGNDISSRSSQFQQSQWCFSKGFDKACPIGPTLVSSEKIPDPSELKIQGIKNGKLVQNSGLDDLIFSIPKIISFLSQGTTLPVGTLILTGTPSGVGTFFDPPDILRDGDEFRVTVDGGIGSLINLIEYEK